MTALIIKAINVPRMTRVTWYKHRASVLGIPGLFLLAAALLFIDRTWRDCVKCVIGSCIPGRLIAGLGAAAGETSYGRVISCRASVSWLR